MHIKKKLYIYIYIQYHLIESIESKSTQKVAIYVYFHMFALRYTNAELPASLICTISVASDA